MNTDSFNKFFWLVGRGYEFVVKSNIFLQEQCKYSSSFLSLKNRQVTEAIDKQLNTASQATVKLLKKHMQNSTFENFYSHETKPCN